VARDADQQRHLRKLLNRLIAGQFDRSPTIPPPSWEIPSVMLAIPSS
jgi:hypothetical protein